MITRIQPNFRYKIFGTENIQINSTKPANANCPISSPVNFCATDTVVFTSRHRKIPNIEIEEYSKLSEVDKIWLREKSKSFHQRVNPSELYTQKEQYLPLSHEYEMKEFVDFSSHYNSAKGAPILCLGRSPKWPLSVSLWMKDGIEDYTFVPFSKSWYDRKIDLMNGDTWLVRNPSRAPNQEQEEAYKKYLKIIGVDPKNIIKNTQKAGTETVITDYLETSRGMTSFLEVMSNLAEEQGVLEEFAKSIRFIVIGSNEYSTNKFFPMKEIAPPPKVILPDKLSSVVPKSLWNPPYPKQEYHTELSQTVFEQMFIYENANESRSGWYSKDNWTKMGSEYLMPKFKQGLQDFRNLLNFKILDYLEANNLLRKL